jgi:hypothetical protein
MSQPVGHEQLELSKSLSAEFYVDPESYSFFDKTKDGLWIIGCIHPTLKAGVPADEYKVIMQTPGGIIGLGTNLSITDTAHQIATDPRNIEPVSIAKGIMDYKALSPDSVADAHFLCAYETNKVAVLEEMAFPSEFTKQSIDDFTYNLDRYNPNLSAKDIVRECGAKVMIAAGLQRENILTYGEQELHEIANELYPQHDNVYGMLELNLSRTYVRNYDPLKGKDSRKKFTTQNNAHLIQGYHDSLGAVVPHAESIAYENKERGRYMMAALIIGSAATQTVITKGKVDQFTLLDAYPDPGALNNISIVERSA